MFRIEGERKPNVLFCYGSQTGTAEDVAERLGREGVARGFRPMVLNCNEAGGAESLHFSWIPRSSEEEEPSKHVVFVVSTTGQGEVPDNMKEFWKSLCKKTVKPGFFEGMKFGVIGLGDSSYSQYNYVAKKLFRRMCQLGASPIAELCLGDDQHDFGYQAAVNPWINRFWQIMETQVLSAGSITLNGDSGMAMGGPFALSKFILGEPLAAGEHLSVERRYNGFNAGLIHRMEVKENQRVTSGDHWQETRLISLDDSLIRRKYQPG
jgi:sulfite reductase alpha subunit-like flavoprotein